MRHNGGCMEPASDIDLSAALPNELTVVELPLLRQLAAMGWECLEGDLDYPEKTGRTSFAETLLTGKLKAALRRVNLDHNGQEWLDDLTLERAVRELTRHEGSGLVEMNRHFMDRLVRGVRVTVAEGLRSGEEVRLFPIVWEPERQEVNEFLAINQFQVLIPGTSYTKRPDIVLFVNGLPLVVIECKSPAASAPLESAVADLLHYSGQKRRDPGGREGVPELFHFNALLVGTDFYHAVAGALGAPAEHYNPWKDVAPTSLVQVRREVGRTHGTLSAQESLVAGMLRPAHLLDLVRNFTVWETDSGRLVKKVARYQQFRAVQRALDRLLNGRTRRQSGNLDERGGVIWHTQGSGKSLTMVFLVKKLRTLPELRGFKIVIVTDRMQLEDQMRATATLTGENVRPSEEEKKRLTSLTALTQEVLREDSPDLVFCMMQKNQDQDLETEVLSYTVEAYTRKDPGEKRADWKEQSEQQQQQHESGSGTAESDCDAQPGEAVAATRKLRQVVPVAAEVQVLNESEQILLLIDECHRTQAGEFHSYMMAALPNAAKIGFTGTPIFRKGDKNTLGIFGTFIDKYGMTASWQDGATVEIVYEGRAADGLVEETQNLDAAFAARFRHYTEEERAIIRKRYGTEDDILEAPRLIAAKARDMMLHYAAEILPGGFKAQVVAVSRQAAVRYQGALEMARDELVGALAALDAEVLALPSEELAEEDEKTQYLVRAHSQLDKLRRLEIAACISGAKDPVEWKQWTDTTNRREHERRFKLPFEHEEPGKSSPLGILVVKNMLLTGFDAPVEQVLYLDRKMQDHELLQAITRVNRTRQGKERGYVVDYAGVGPELAAALKAIRELEEEDGDGDAPGGLVSIADALPRLRAAHERVMQIFTGRGITNLLPVDPPVQLLEDARIRAEFIAKVRAFLSALGVIFTRPEAAAFKRDAKILAFIARVASNVYQDPQLLLLGVEAKVKELVDAYIAAEGIDPKVPPLSLMDAGFDDQLRRHGNTRTRASAMGHAIRLQLVVKMDEDPALYASLSEKLKAILQEMDGRWDEMIRAFEGLIQELARADEAWQVEGLNSRVHGPFFGTLKLEREACGMPAMDEDPELLSRVVALVKNLVSEIRGEIRRVDFWRDPNSRRQLENQLYQTLRRSGVVPRERAENLSVQMVEIAWRKRRILSA